MAPPTRANPTLRALAGPLLAGPLLAGVTSGQTDQTDPPPAETESQPDARLNPALTDRSLDDVISQRTTRPTPGSPLLPIVAPTASQVVPNQPADPGALELASGALVWTDALTLLPEGTFLARRVGEVVRLRTGGLAFLPAARDEAVPPPAIAMLPCETYGRLGDLLGEGGSGLWVALTGEVFTYHGRNYVLPSTFSSASVPEAAPVAEPAGEGRAPGEEPDSQPESQPENQPETQPGTDPTGDRRIDDLVRDLESQRSERRGIDTTFRTDPERGEPAEAGPYIEGRMLLGQRGRMVRTSQGGWAVAIDNDADVLDEALPRTLRLLPTGMVEQMERQAERDGDRWTFQVSGNLYRHGDAVYLVPRMFISLPSDEVRAMQ